MADQVEPRDDRALLPIHVGGHKVYVAVSKSDVADKTSDEQEVAFRPAALDGVLAGLGALVDDIGTALNRPGLSQVSVEIGCDFTLESGTLFAVLGKAGSRAGMVVRLEWTPQT
jgi:hypothetical protein